MFLVFSETEKDAVWEKHCRKYFQHFLSHMQFLACLSLWIFSKEKSDARKNRLWSNYSHFQIETSNLFAVLWVLWYRIGEYFFVKFIGSPSSVHLVVPGGHQESCWWALCGFAKCKPKRPRDEKCIAICEFMFYLTSLENLWVVWLKGVGVVCSRACPHW